MIFRKKNLQAIVRVTLIVFLLCTLMSFTVTMPTYADISQPKYNLITLLYGVLDGVPDSSGVGDDDKRAAILKVVTGRANVDSSPYAMINIKAGNAAVDMANAIDAIIDPAPSTLINTTNLKLSLLDFYEFQLLRPTEASFTLGQFKTGFDIMPPIDTSSFAIIANKINDYTYDYLMFINFVKEVKDNFNIIKSNNKSPLYEGQDGLVYVYPDLEQLAELAQLFAPGESIDRYRTRLKGLITALNGEDAAQRRNFINNLAAYDLIDKYTAPSEPGDGPTGGGTSGGTTGGTTGGAQAPHGNSDGSASTTIPAVLNSSTGNAAATVSQNTISQLLTLSKPQENGTKDIIIDVPKVDGAKSYTLNLPGNALTKSAASENITIKTGAGNITMPSNIFAGDNSVKDKNVSLSIAESDKSILSTELQQKIGDKPVISLSFTVNGVTKEYDNPSSPVTVSFRYTPTGAEATGLEFLTVWYIDSAGNLIEVPSGKYNPATGLVSFTTTHFSKYVLIFNQKTFADVTNTHWAQKEIEVMASKGIARGTADKTFAPNESITRGDYMAMLVRALGVNAVITENFSDIKATDINFKEIAIAKKLGITNGVGNNMFKPDDFITRQDLMVLTERALSVVKKIKVKGVEADLAKFADNSKVAPYAKVSVATMVKEGILIGDGSEIGPVEKTTRAQAAAIVYRIYNK